MFYDREEAGERLAIRLRKFKGLNNLVVLAIPRGGIIPGYIISKELNAPLEVVMIKKLGHPYNPEFAIGAVSMSGRIISDSIGISEEYIEEATRKIQKLLKDRYLMYHGDKPPELLKNKTVIVVDDGVATGKTLMAALTLIRAEKPDKIIVAVPVGPAQTIDSLKGFADEVICLETPPDFWAIGLHYKKFYPVSDLAVKDLLLRSEKNLHPDG